MKHHRGRIEVICGSMFSGKTEELIRRVRRAQIARQQVHVFKPVIDTRYSASRVTSHNGQDYDARPCSNSAEIAQCIVPATTVVAIDEAQFFDDGVVAAAQRLADQSKRVIVAGLDKDFRGLPFGPIPALMAVAEDVTKTLAICVRCGSPANNTQRLVESDELVVVGAQGVYEARCRRCFEPPSRG